MTILTGCCPNQFSRPITNAFRAATIKVANVSSLNSTTKSFSPIKIQKRTFLLNKIAAFPSKPTKFKAQHYSLGQVAFYSSNTTESSNVFNAAQSSQPNVNLTNLSEASADQNSSILSQISSDLSAPIAESASTIAESVSQLASKIGDFKALGLCNNTPVGLVERFFEFAHVYTGLPWWGTIVVATLTFKVVLFPIAAALQKNTIKMQNVQPKLAPIKAKLERAKRDNNTVEYRTQASLMRSTFQAENVNPFLSLMLPLIQMPIVISFFMALRSMSSLPVPGFETEGILWFTNLAASDPYYILPVLAAGSMISLFEVNRLLQNSIAQSPIMTWSLRGVGILTAIVTINFDTSIFIYFLVNNVLSVFQVWLLSLSSVRSLFKIPAVQKVNLAYPPKNSYVKFVESKLKNYTKK
ncbi:hypothetical protein BB561_001395 [Smittium simulii]|uniref:Membrane insertase YidC/Oxa/ALB C-terminal domain-containing protein n=1 Tax=Smittium simulii TaxID=133385 RepID=A0A2T9YUV6_9FUNG|nr:hypothetical protein BB561_001395 [Smittium simulii]